MLQYIKAAWSVLSALRQFQKEYEAKGIARLSPEMAKRDRRRLERLALAFIEKKDTGWRKVVKVDDPVGLYLKDLLQSRDVEIFLTGSTLDREQARKAILTGADRVVVAEGFHGI